MSSLKATESEQEAENKSNALILNYIHNHLMQQMFQDTLAKIAKIAWGNIAIYRFETAKEIADRILLFEPQNVIGHGVLCRIYTEQKQYEKAVEIFEANITEQRCNDDEMLHFNLMPYYAISLCFDAEPKRKEKGNQIMQALLERVDADKDKEDIHVIHKEQIYRWYGYKLQHFDKDYQRAIQFYHASFMQSDLVKYPRKSGL